MKELILITSHTPDNNREHLLRNLVKCVKNTEYDIMVVSHTSIPKDIMEDVDYFFFEKKNSLLYNIKDKAMSIFENNDFIIRTTETKKYNHGIAFLRLLKAGLINAKNLKYKKVHFFEYDSLITDFQEIEENSKLIESVGVVCYKPTGISWPNSPISFNLEKISKLWFELSEDNYYEFMSDRYSKLSEEYQMYLIKDGGEYVFKDILVLNDKGINVGLQVDSEKFPWIVVVHNGSINEMTFFGKNETINQIEVKIIINNKDIFSKNINPNLWSLFKVGNFNEVNHVIIMVNNEIKNILDFNLIDREMFKERNFLKIK
jgi:hypothetical protein